jgi:fatty-acyl-CoA synthase
MQVMQIEDVSGLGDTVNTAWRVGGEPRLGRIARVHLRSQADIRTVEGWQPETLLPGRTIYECIKAAASLNPAKAAMICLVTHNIDDAPRVVTYGQLIASIERAANLFREVAIDAPSAVAAILPMVPEGLIATWGAATAGICVPINPHLEITSVVSIMNAARVTALVTTPDGFGALGPDALHEIRRQVPTLRRVLYVGSNDPANDFMTAIDAYPSGRLTFPPATDMLAEAMHMPTGGTTGAPKLVRMTHGGQLTIAWNVGALMGSTVDGVVGHAMPNFHCGGAISLGLRTIIYGQTLLTLTPDGFRNQGVVRNFWNIARHYRMTSVLATPTTAAAILAVEGTTSEGNCLSDFHCGGSTVPLELMRAFHRRFGVWLRENWGMTELHGTTTGHPNDGKEPHVGSVGCSLPFYRTKAVIVDEANAFVSECAPGERGVLVIGGPSITPGYADSRLDDAFFITGMPDGKVWANTGDLGAVDESGYVWVFGRAKDLIIRGGHNIDPRMIEEVLMQHPAIQLAAAVGKPDALKGELPIAYVQLKEGAKVSISDLFEFCRGRIQERASLPVEIFIIDAIPQTAVGKISKPALRMDAMQRVVSSVAAKVIGNEGRFDAMIDQSGRRPSAILTINIGGGAANADLIRASLQEALAGYEFATRIELARAVTPTQ